MQLGQSPAAHYYPIDHLYVKFMMHRTKIQEEYLPELKKHLQLQRGLEEKQDEQPSFIIKKCTLHAKKHLTLLVDLLGQHADLFKTIFRQYDKYKKQPDMPELREIVEEKLPEFQQNLLALKTEAASVLQGLLLELNQQTRLLPLHISYEIELRSLQHCFTTHENLVKDLTELIRELRTPSQSREVIQPPGNIASWQRPASSSLRSRGQFATQPSASLSSENSSTPTKNNEFKGSRWCCRVS